MPLANLPAQASSLRSRTSSTGNARNVGKRKLSTPWLAHQRARQSNAAASKTGAKDLQYAIGHEICSIWKKDMLFMPAASVYTAKSGAAKTGGNKETDCTINMRVCLHLCKLREAQHTQAITNATH